MKIVKMVVVLLLFVSCQKNTELTLKSFQVNQGWGYSIEMNDKIIIKQSVIPTLPNKKSFISEGDALKVGNLVLDRITQKISPTITKKDLILLKISI
jgi:hypothetical protein